jgi:hypothetical protein
MGQPDGLEDHVRLATSAAGDRAGIARRKETVRRRDGLRKSSPSRGECVIVRDRIHKVPPEGFDESQDDKDVAGRDRGLLRDRIDGRSRPEEGGPSPGETLDARFIGSRRDGWQSVDVEEADDRRFQEADDRRCQGETPRAGGQGQGRVEEIDNRKVDGEAQAAYQAALIRNSAT